MTPCYALTRTKLYKRYKSCIILCVCHQLSSWKRNGSIKEQFCSWQGDYLNDGFSFWMNSFSCWCNKKTVYSKSEFFAECSVFFLLVIFHFNNKFNLFKLFWFRILKVSMEGTFEILVPHPQFRDEETEVPSGHYMPYVEEETMSDDFQPDLIVSA